MGPLGVRIEPLGRPRLPKRDAVFREQAERWSKPASICSILETFSDLNEMREAIFAAREAAGEEMVIVAHVTIDDFGNLPGGTTPETFTRKLDEWPARRDRAQLLGRPEGHARNHRADDAHSTKPMSAMPNAGLPAAVEGRNIYLCSPEYMAQYARRLLWAGVRIVGGCCGTTRRAHQADPRRSALAAAAAAQETDRHRGEPQAKPQALPPVPVREKSQAGREAGRGQIRLLRGDSAAARRGCVQRNRRRAPVRRSMASIASTCPTARAPARA